MLTGVLRKAAHESIPTLSRQVLGILLGAAVMAFLVTGCGDDDNAETAEARLPTPSSSPTAEGAGALPLERFHYAASMTIREIRADGVPGEVVVSTDGDFQGPDRHAFTYTTKIGDLTVQESVVIIGLLAWACSGGGA